MSDARFMASLFSGIGMVIAFCIFANAVLDNWQCGETARAMDRNSKWSVATGCMIQTTGGQWMPLSNVRTVTP